MAGCRVCGERWNDADAVKVLTRERNGGMLIFKRCCQVNIGSVTGYRGKNNELIEYFVGMLEEESTSL